MLLLLQCTRIVQKRSKFGFALRGNEVRVCLDLNFCDCNAHKIVLLYIYNLFGSALDVVGPIIAKS